MLKHLVLAALLTAGAAAAYGQAQQQQAAQPRVMASLTRMSCSLASVIRTLPQ